MSDYESKQRKRNIVVGLFVIIGFCALVWLIFKFGDLPGFVTELDSFEIYVQFPTAPGVQKDTPVQFCGYQIGRVTHVQAPSIRPDLKTGQGYYQIVIIISVNNQYKTIPSNVDVKMMTRGLGSSYIELKEKPGLFPVPLDPNRPETRFLTKGVLLQGSTGATSEFFPEESQEKLSQLIDGIKTFVDNANKIFGNPDNQNNLELILANLATATEQAKSTLKSIETFADKGTSTLAHTDTKLVEIVTDINNTTRDIREFVTTGTELLKNTNTRSDEIVKSLVSTIEETSKTVAQLRLVMEKINTGQGTIAKFVNDPQFYDKLVEDTKQLSEVLTSLKAIIGKIDEKGLGKVWSGKE